MIKKEVVLIVSMLAFCLCASEDITLDPVDVVETRVGPLSVEALDHITDSIRRHKKQFVREVDTTIAFSFFDNGLASGGYTWTYPDPPSRMYIPEGTGRIGEVALVFDLFAGDYAGGAIALYGNTYDVSDIVYTGALEFWIRGEEGGEQCLVGFADSDADGQKIENKLHLSNYGAIRPFWTKISIPLADFGRRGAYWDPRKEVEVSEDFEWSAIQEFLLTINAPENDEFKVYVDQIVIRDDVYDSSETFDEPYWEEMPQVLSDHGPVDEDISVHTELFDGSFEGDAFGFRYGGRTAFKTYPLGEEGAEDSALAMFFDNTDYSGVSVRFGRTYDLDSLRDNGGGLGFWLKTGEGVDEVHFGPADDEKSGGHSVSTTLNLSDFGEFDTSWNYFAVPLQEFRDEGTWWNPATGVSELDEMDWSTIFEIGFTTNKYGNRIPPGEPAEVFISDMALIDSVPGYVDPEAYWDEFESDAPDRLLFDFEDLLGNFGAYAGSSSSISADITFQTDVTKRDRLGGHYLQVSYTLGDWALASYDFIAVNAPESLYEWDEHRALRLDMYTDQDEESIDIQLTDAGGEAWSASVTVEKGWNSVVVPFRDFRANLYQQPGAERDGKMDLEQVKQFSIVPRVMGLTSTVLVDNVYLTNSLEEESFDWDE
jgi:hypothetical protein